MSLSDRERLRGIVRSFSGRRVAVLADLVADEFIYGDIERVSREAPVLILAEQRVERSPGGGGNAIANLRALGARPLPVGVVGRDEGGDWLVEAFGEIGVATGGVLRAREYRTPVKSRVLAGGVHTRRQQIVRIDRGTPRGLPLGPAVGARLAAALERATARAEGLLIADYGYEAATPARAAPQLRALARRRLPVTVDSRARIEAYRGVAACTPNLEELEQSAGRTLTGRAGIARAARELRSRMRAGAVLVTLGSEGVALYPAEGRAARIPAWGSDEVADVTGAGDTVVATFTLALVAGADYLDAARLANYAAGIVVQKAGTATLGADELLAAIEEDLC